MSNINEQREFEKRKQIYAEGLRELKAKNPEKYNNFVEVCREYHNLKHKYKADHPSTPDPNALAEVHLAFSRVRQGIIFSSTSLDKLDLRYDYDIVNELTDVILAEECSTPKKQDETK